MTRTTRSSITPTKGRPAPPKQLTGEALEEWNRVCDELDQMGVLTTSDRSVISLYVRAWERWMKAEDRLALQSEIVGSPKTNTPMQNPWLSISIKANEQAVRLLSEIGLTPRSRSIIAKNTAAGDDAEPADNFADLD